MNHATYNLLEGVVRATIKIAETTLPKDESDDLRADLSGKLTSLKIATQRDENEAIVQAMAQVVLALAKHVLGRPVKVGEGDVSRHDLLSVARELDKPPRLPEPDSSGLPHMNIEAPMPDVRPAKEPASKAQIELYGIDNRWKIITDESGDPVAALYFNGRMDSLSQEQVEEIEEALLPIIRRWGR